MSTHARPMLVHVLGSIVLLAACSLAFQAAAPRGWFIAGSTPNAYESGVETAMSYSGHPSAYVRSNTQIVEGFGTLMQDFRNAGLPRGPLPWNERSLQCSCENSGGTELGGPLDAGG